jgi:hypothetical protein
MRARADGSLTFFVGPTLAGSARARALLRGTNKKPPIKRHDVEKLVGAEKKPGTIVIVDGVFHDTLAVGHAEIREALERGWVVWGLSSMGAIRAREMRVLGMRGFGRVFRRFCDERDDFQDDEVALLHEPRPPYRAASEPLVHLRAAVDHLVATKVVGAAAARDVVRDLKEQWYGERTLAGAIRALSPHAARGAVLRELEPFAPFRWKTLDLEDFLLTSAHQLRPTRR